MKFTFDSEIFEKVGINIKEFAILLYYIDNGTGVVNTELCNDLWNKNYLVKSIDGYTINNNKFSEIEDLLASCNIPKKKEDDNIIELAKQLKGIFPQGKKEGTNYYWADGVSIIAKRLQMFFRIYGNSYTNEQIINATKKYVESFNGNYCYMRLLKYFILKNDRDAGGNVDEKSELLSYIENAGQEENLKDDWISTLK